MKIHICNPNTNNNMTSVAAAAAKSVAAQSTTIVASQPEDGPESIEGYYDEVFSIPGLIGEIQRHGDCDGHVVACFDDTGLDAARCVTESPVVGLCEAGCYAALMLGNKFSIVTTLERSVPALERLTQYYGVAHRCASIRASNIPVLDLENTDTETTNKLHVEIETAIVQDKAEVIVLGCAGMADLAKQLSQRYSLPVVDGVSAAVKAIEGLVSMQLTTSKVLGYQAPRAKAYRGRFKEYQPN